MPAGYAALIEGSGRVQAGSAPAMANVCSGWRDGGAAAVRAGAGDILLDPSPWAPSLERLVSAPGDFHVEPEPRERSMLRRRVLEVRRLGTDLDVYSYFRDSYRDADGRERSLHEYVIHARVAGDPLVITAVEATPHALPFPECPLAARNAADLIGVPVAELGTVTGSLLAGARGCTHLTDALRFLRHVPALTPRADDRQP